MMSPGLTEPTDDETTTSFLDEHLSLIIGVPTGIGLCILMFVGCLIYCGKYTQVCTFDDNINSTVWFSIFSKLIDSVICSWCFVLFKLNFFAFFVGISALYHSWKEKKLQSNSVSGTGTKTTGIPLATPHSSTADYNSSSYHASYFEPSEDTLPQRHNKDKSNQQEAIDHAFEPSEDTLPRRHNKEKQQAIDVEQTSTF